MKRKLLALFCENNILIQPEVIDFILSENDPQKFAQKILYDLELESCQMILTVEDIKKYKSELTEKSDSPNHQDNVQSERELPSNLPVEIETFTEPSEPKNEQNETPQIEIRLPSQFKPEGKEYDGDIKILKDVTGNSTCEGNIQNFVNYFNDRFNRLRKILKVQRREIGGTISINRGKKIKGRPIRIIGMVNSVRNTKQDHKMVELEDEGGKITALILNTTPSISVPIVVDDVIGIIGTIGKNDLIYVDEVIFPDVPRNGIIRTTREPVSCAFISDIHVGSNTFLSKSWLKFIDWLKGKYDHEKKIAERVKYLIMPGDVVEGIGIYPDQEKELDISDVFAQYEQLAEYLEEIPDYIKIILQPGNHDAVRLAEPQPTFSQEIMKYFSSDIIFVGNPCYFSIHNIEILSYHGRSMDDFVLKIPKLTYNTPIQMMQEMLTRRHLAPVYGEKNLFAPESRDYMVIDQIPDIFVTGHVHKAEYRNYRGISLLNASAWQTQTSYQKIMNFHPDPGKVGTIDLSTREFRFVNFVT
jgi:DNA polymerase II small subunit